MKPGIDPKVDLIFKILFGVQANLELLLSLLNAVLGLRGDDRLTWIEIRNPYNDKEKLDGKLSILDIKARDKRGRQYNIEMQMIGTFALTNRLLFYWAELHTDQLHEGEDYRNLQPTISICFVNSVLFPQVSDYHLDFQPRCSKHPELVFSGHQLLHLVELPKFTKKPEELVDALDIWCYFLIHGEELDTDNLPAALKVPAVERAMEVLQVVTHNDVERERYRARLKAQRDEFTNIAIARDEARDQGRTEGIVELIQTLQLLLKEQSATTEELLALPLDELRARAQQLRERLGVSPT